MVQSGFPLGTNELITAAGGEFIGRPAGMSEMAIDEVVLDSRRAGEGKVFLCQIGSSIDPHDLIPEAREQGCRFFIGEHREKLAAAAAKHPDCTVLFVASARTAAHRIASAMRHKLVIPVIAITGACGKTSTKDLCGGILCAAVPTVVTPVNNNNLWGVPLTLMELRADHRAAVIELGTNEPGEVAQLAPLVDPTITYTTSIGPSHLMNFRDIDGVLAAETEHIEWLISQKRPVTYIGNIDDPLLRKYYTKRRTDLSSYGRFVSLSMDPEQKADITVSKIEALGFAHNFGYSFSWHTPWGEGNASLPLPGLYNVQNSLAAIALALATHLVTPEEASLAVARPKLSPLRSELIRLDSGTLFLNDCYNANPLSMRSAFETVVQISRNSRSGVSRKVLVAGDMLELGEKERQYHAEIGEQAARSGFDYFLTSGAFAKDYEKGFLDAAAKDQIFQSFETREQLFEALTAILNESPSETLVLVKGSKGSKIFEVAAKLHQSSRS